MTGAVGGAYEERYRQTYRIAPNLSPQELQRLEAFLKRLPSQEVVSIDELAALKNNVADAEIAQEAPPKGMLSWFLEMYADSKQGDLWRGYIVQKMAEIIQRLKSPDDVKRGVYFLWSQLRAQHPIEAALGLDRLHEARPDLV